MEWNSENEGQDRFGLEYLPSTETFDFVGDLIDSQEWQSFSWSVIDEDYGQENESLASETTSENQNIRLLQSSAEDENSIT